VKFALLLIAAGCSASAAALFLIFEVERGAVDGALWHYALSALLAVVVPALALLAWRAVTPLRGFVASTLVYALTAAGIGGTFGLLLLRL
jgi:hypothetical protein